MAAVNLLEQAHAAGLKVFTRGEQLVVRGPRSAEPLAKTLLVHKAEVLSALRCEHMPFIDQYGILVIPTEAAKKYSWWGDGQSVRETLDELGAPPEVLMRYVDADLAIQH